MEQNPLTNPEGVPRLNQCYLCKTWHLEKNLQAIEIPDQGSGYIRKGGRSKKAPEKREALSISTQRLSEFRKLAEIPEKQFRERIEVAKAKEEKIT